MKFHPLIYILWFPIWLLTLVIFNFLLPDLHGYIANLFWISQILLFWIGRKQIASAIKKPETILVIVSLLFTFGMLELAMRMVDTPFLATYKEAHRALDQHLWSFQRNHYIGFVANPDNAETTGDLVNSYAFRGPEIILPKPEGVFRIVAMGGSTTWGTGVGLWVDTYPHQLEIELQDEYGYDSVEVINAGQASYNSFETLMNFQFRVLDLQPDMIIIYQNTNDVHTRIVPPELYRGDNSARRKPWDIEAYLKTQNPLLRIPSLLVRFVLFTTGLVELPSPDIDTYISQDCSGEVADESCLGMTPMEALEANPPIYYQRNLENIIAIANQQDVDVVFMTWAHSALFDDYAAREEYEFAFEQHNELMVAIAGEYNIPVFDLVPLMPADVMYWADGRHMNAEGNQLQAELLAEFLANDNLIPE